MTWGVTIHLDGEPVTGIVPCDDWTAAVHFAELLVAAFGGSVSVAHAVVTSRPKDYEEPSLFDEPAEAA